MSSPLDILTKLPALAQEAGKTAGELAPTADAVGTLLADPAIVVTIDNLISVLTALKTVLPVLAPAVKTLAEDMRELAKSSA